jgi:hypothetical protein
MVKAKMKIAKTRFAIPVFSDMNAVSDYVNVLKEINMLQLIRPSGRYFTNVAAATRKKNATFDNCLSIDGGHRFVVLEQNEHAVRVMSGDVEGWIVNEHMEHVSILFSDEPGD